ncbi:toxin glutamine deamidase domain-containing protein [Saccharopolyspora dendranthemae]|uniref:toxin glutamine deamidase domain-containing protein n=1 Tax=Saccharopolyspora dendranthemae TaxID=1181886 RepID=UPI003CCC75E2
MAEREDSTQSFSGIQIAESVTDTQKAIESGDWAAGVMGAVGAGLDALSMALDPFGAIFSAGVGWLMEHVGPVSDALDSLTGDPDEIKSHSETWKNISAELEAVNTEMRDLVKADVANWMGEAADAYRARSEDTANLIAAAKSAADGAADGIGTAGEVVAGVRTLVRDIIAELVGHLVSWALQVICTLGIAMAWVVPQVVAEVAKVASKIADITTKLVKAMKALTPLLKKLSKGFGDAGKQLNKIKADGSKNNGPGNAKNPDVPHAPTGPQSNATPKKDGPASTSSQSADPPPTSKSPDTPPPTDVGAGRGGPRGDGPPPSQFGAPLRPPPPQTRTGRPIARPPRGQQQVPPQNPVPPPQPQVVSASSFANKQEADQFMRDHFGPVQQINKDKFDAQVPGHNTNCGNCTVATAHTIKTGTPYQVDPAKPMTLDDVGKGSVPHGSAGKFDPVPGGYNELSQSVAQQPPGFVASVAAKWDGDEIGHFFNAVKHPNGAVVYVDGQSGMPADISRPPRELYAMGYPNQNTVNVQPPGPPPSAPAAPANPPAVDDYDLIE